MNVLSRRNLVRLSIRTAGFTLIELLVVLSIIALLIALLLPALQRAKRSAQGVHCLSRHGQLMVAVTAFSADDKGYFPPMQRIVRGVEYSWRGLLYPYTSRNPDVFDCPSEEEQRYASGAFDDRGQPTPNETYVWSGIGAVNVHWNTGANGPFLPPFGRYDTRHPEYGTARCWVANWNKVEAPAEMICLGDGNSSYTVDGQLLYFPEDAFWIYKGAAVGSSGYNRAFVPSAGGQRERGLERHGADRDANYAFADGSAKLLDADEIPCSQISCWWDARKSPH